MNNHQPKRLIARLDVKGENLIKGIHLEGLRVIGDPQEFAMKYYTQGADEIIYLDIVASLYGRSNLIDIVKKTAQNIFIPLTVGGGIRNLEDVSQLLHAGADKIAINTAVVKNPALISEVSNKYGSQCMVLSIEAKKNKDKAGWEVYTDCGRESSGLDVEEWVKDAITLGVGEILVTSIDQEGTRKGFDIELIEKISSISPVPVIASGGFGQSSHLLEACASGADAIAFADSLHYERFSLEDLRDILIKNNILTRAVN
ncbi:MAG: imidazole glycerol phosphate synthase subunit HisF [Methylophilaceae bacterium]|nr:imidazole glycerol phosphate synthase subunit HisF [Methylophilaceae bacterium]